MKKHKNNFGNYLKNLREDYGYTLGELAETIGFSGAYLSQIEKGRKPAPGVEMLKQLSETLKTPYSGLLREAGYEELGEGQYYKELYSSIRLEQNDLVSNKKHIVNEDLNYSIDLIDIHFVSVIDWLKDKRLSDQEKNYLKKHFAELLLRYKKVIKSLTIAKENWASLERSSIKLCGNEITIEELQDAYIKKEIEKYIDDTSKWIYGIQHFQ